MVEVNLVEAASSRHGVHEFEGTRVRPRRRAFWPGRSQNGWPGILLLLPASLGLIWLSGELLSGAERLGTPPAIWDVWKQIRISPPDPYRLRHSDLKTLVQELVRKGRGQLELEEAGRSAEGRELYLLQWGGGSLRVLLWSQMHGDEPTATSALLDILNLLVSEADDPSIELLSSRLRLYVLPMLNPDGAERTRRRNAQGIDINRDALTLTTPEARTLKAVRDRFQPQIGFNLHDQNPRVSVGDTLKPVMISLLAVPFDRFGNDSAGRMRSKRICARIYETLGPYGYGHVARYDDAFNVRAFGDQMTAWGTSTVLLESGSPLRGQSYLVRLNFLALLDVFTGLADGSLESANPAVYDSLRENARGLLFDWIFKNAMVVSGNPIPPYRTDVAVTFVSSYDEDKNRHLSGAVEEVGDLSVFGAAEIKNATDWLISPSDLRKGPAEGEILPGSATLFVFARVNPEGGMEPSNLTLLGALRGGLWEGILR